MGLENTTKTETSSLGYLRFGFSCPRIHIYAPKEVEIIRNPVKRSGQQMLHMNQATAISNSVSIQYQATLSFAYHVHKLAVSLQQPRCT